MSLTFIIVAIVWYLLGVGGWIYICKEEGRHVTVGNLVLTLTLGGTFGTFIIIFILVDELTNIEFWNRKLF